MRERSYIFNFNVRLLKIIAFVALLVPLAVWVSDLYENAAGKNAVNAWNHQRFNDFYALPDNTLDLVFIGSSHSYCTFDPELFDALLGVRSYQMGMPLQHPDATYYTLREVLKTQSPSVVVMELYWGMMEKPFSLKQAASFFEVVNDKTVTDDFIKNVFPLAEKIKYFFKPIRFQLDFIMYKNNEFLKCLEEKYGVKKQIQHIPGEEYFKEGGFIYCDYIIPDEKFTHANQFLHLDGKGWSVDDTQKEFIGRIASLCRDNDIKLAFVTAPVANISHEYIQNYIHIHDAVAVMTEDMGIKYIDYNMVLLETGFLTDENFRDDAHVNYGGAVVVGTHFANWLTANFNVYNENIYK